MASTQQDADLVRSTFELIQNALRERNINIDINALIQPPVPQSNTQYEPTPMVPSDVHTMEQGPLDNGSDETFVSQNQCNCDEEADDMEVDGSASEEVSYQFRVISVISAICHTHSFGAVLTTYRLAYQRGR